MNKTWNLVNVKNIPYEKVSFWLDWLSFSVKSSQYFFSHFTYDLQSKLDDDNANMSIAVVVDEIFTFTKTKISNWTAYYFSMVYNSVPFTVFCYVDYNDHTKKMFNTDWTLIVYGAYFRILELWYFSDDFLEYFKNFYSDLYITRCDYRYDFFSEKYFAIPAPYDIFPNMRKDKKKRLWKKWDNLISWDLWNKLNYTVFIRFYNKNIELQWNLKKLYLYWDIEQYKTFFRLEFELWSKFTNGFLGKEIDLLIEKINTMTWINPWDYQGTQYKARIVTDLSSPVHMHRYVKIFCSMAENLYNNGINPHEILTINNPNIWQFHQL